MNKQKAFNNAINNNDIESVKLLINDSQVDINRADDWAFQLCSEKGYTEIFKLLLKDERIIPYGYSNYAIRYAFQNKHFDIVRALLEKDILKKILKKNDIKLYNEIAKKLIKKNIEKF
jgi:hypothetical protein